jgi:hypothetical protein
MPVDVLRLSTVCVPCENGSTNGKRGILHDVHIPYDYNEVF